MMILQARRFSASAFLTEHRSIKLYRLLDGRVGRPQVAFADLHGSLVQGFGGGVIALAIVEKRQIVETGGNIEVVWSKSVFLGLQRLL